MPCRHAKPSARRASWRGCQPGNGPSALQRHFGTWVEEKHTAEAQQPWKEEADAREHTHRRAISADGAPVSMTGEVWADVRTLAIGDVPDGSRDAEKVHVEHLSSCSRMTDAAHRTDLADVETRRRHVVQATEACAVMDRAERLPSSIEIHRASSGQSSRRRASCHTA